MNTTRQITSRQGRSNSKPPSEHKPRAPSSQWVQARLSSARMCGTQGVGAFFVLPNDGVRTSFRLESGAKAPKLPRLSAFVGGAIQSRCQKATGGRGCLQPPSVRISLEEPTKALPERAVPARKVVRFAQAGLLYVTSAAPAMSKGRKAGAGDCRAHVLRHAVSPVSRIRSLQPDRRGGAGCEPCPMAIGIEFSQVSGQSATAKIIAPA